MVNQPSTIPTLNAARSAAAAGVCVLLLLVFVGCDDQPSGANTEAASQSSASASSNLASWLELLPNDLNNSMTLKPVRFPEDIGPHPEARVESLMMRAILSSDGGEWFSVQAQLDRLQVRAYATSESSAWSFSSVARAGIATGSSQAATLQQVETIERVALGLAASGNDQLQVGNTRLSLKTATEPNACTGEFDFASISDDAQPISLQGRWLTCPQSLNTAQINRWQNNALPALGRVAGNPVSGQVWLSNSWGNTVPTGGAVVLDRISLSLVGQDDMHRVLNVTRSKRRSGRGPQTVTAEWEGEQGAARVPELQWLDEGSQVSALTGNAYPTHFRLLDSELALNLTLTPLVVLPELADAWGARWSGAVQVTGSHTGSGFVDVVPLSDAETSSAAAATIRKEAS